MMGAGVPLPVIPEIANRTLSNVFLGEATGNRTTTGQSNVGLGSHALEVNRGDNSGNPDGTQNGWFNTAVGYYALAANLDGSSNNAFGAHALEASTTTVRFIVAGITTDPTVGAVYTTESINYTVVAVHLYGTAPNREGFLFCTETTLPAAASGTITKVSGTGDATIAFSVQGLWSGYNNIALGSAAMRFNIAGFWNCGIGAECLNKNTTGYSNTAVAGYDCMLNNTTGYSNTAVGHLSMYENTIGYWNTAFGDAALRNNVVGNFNVLVGNSAGFNLTTSYNTGVGVLALYSATTGEWNTALGYDSLYSNVAGDGNVSVGYQAGRNAAGDYSVFVGYQAGYSATGGHNICIGESAGYNITTGDYNVCIGRNTDTPAASSGARLNIANLVYGRFDETAQKSLGIAAVPGASAVLDCGPTTTKGFKPPSMTTTQRNAINSPIEGLIVYDLTLHMPYVYNGSAWKQLAYAIREYTFVIPGDLSVANDLTNHVRATYPGVCIAASAIAKTGPATTAAIFRIKKNGTSAIQDTLLEIAASATVGTSTAFNAAGTFAAGDYFSIDVTQIGTGTVGADVSVTLTCLLTV